MRRTATLPFAFKREQQVVGMAVTTTTDDIHGLLHLTGDRIRLQWRLAREVAHVGMEIRTERAVGDVVEAEVSLADLAGAEVRRRWWGRLGLRGGLEFVLRAADLRAFEVVAGSAGLALSHPAELVIPVRWADRLAAQEFAAELNLAVAEQGLPNGGGEGPALVAGSEPSRRAEGQALPGKSRGAV